MPDASTPVVSLKGGGTKTIVFIRHAESTWNRALKRQPFRLPTALADVDHAITHMGYAQSAALQRALRDTPASDASGLATAHRDTAVWASPQTRALQTALVALQPLFQRSVPPHVQLRPMVREKRGGPASRDNVGVGVGDELIARACDRLASLESDEASLAAMRLAASRCELDEVQRPWWTAWRESRGAARTRAAALVAELRACDHEVLIVVTHSHFVRTVLAEHLDWPGAAGHGEEGGHRARLCGALQTRAIPNCGVLVCTLDGESERPLRAPRLCYPPGAGEQMAARGRTRSLLSRLSSPRAGQMSARKVAPAPLA